MHAPCAHLSSNSLVRGSCSSRFARGTPLKPSARLFAKRKAFEVTAAAAGTLTKSPKKESSERFRLNNLSPQKGARRLEKRKGRGYGSGQGGTCGFGMRGQKARSGSGVRDGFEGGQTALYRRLPKLKGIAGGMSAGLPKYNIINLNDLAKKFAEGEEVSIETLQHKRMLNLSGKEAKLPLKVLGDGNIKLKLKIKAAKFSSSAKEKIEAAGGEIIEVPQKPKWTRALHRQKVRAAAAAAPQQPAEKKKPFRPTAKKPAKSPKK